MRGWWRTTARVARCGWWVGGAALAVARMVLVLTTAYLDVLALAAWRQQHATEPSDFPPAPPRRRLAVLVPAHDEERLIGSSVASLVGQDYPPDLFEVYVVADNCSDETATLAAAAGAEVHERSDPARPGKGPALEWLRERVGAGAEAIDAYVFVDADTIADEGFLRAVDRALGAGAPVVQGHYAVRDAESSPVVAFRAAALAVRNYARPFGRNAIGGTAGLLGNGMAFRSDVLATRRWTDHLTEDAELTLDLLLDGTTVAFAPDAKVRAEMPVTLEAAESQHERWESGRLDLTRRYLPALLRRTALGGPLPRRAYVDAAADQLIPPLSLVVGATGIWTLAAALRPAFTRSTRVAPTAFVALAGQGAATLGALRMVDAQPALYKALLSALRMIVWKVALMVRVVTRPGQGRWVRTERN